MTAPTIERIEQLFNVPEKKYCHAVCWCNSHLSLCGAYKPVLCGILIRDAFLSNACPVCKKDYCPDCEELLSYVCDRCGE